MNKRIKKTITYIATLAFLFALAINVKISFEGPSVSLGDIAIASSVVPKRTPVTTYKSNTDSTWTSSVGCPAGQVKTYMKITTTKTTTCPIPGSYDCYPGTTTTTSVTSGECTTPES